MNRIRVFPVWVFIPLLLVLPGAGGGDPVRVMSFNIRYGTADDGNDSWMLRKESLLQLIRDQSPQLMGLQEALRFQLDEIRRAFPQFAESGCGRDDGHFKGEYAAILYDTTRFAPVSEGTFWFSDTPSMPGSIGWGNRITRICTWIRLLDTRDARTVDVYNLHLDHESQPSRYLSVQALLDTIRLRSSASPVLVIGDFNAGEMNPAIRLLREASFFDTYRKINPRDSLAGTFHGFKGSRTGEKIDYIFADARTTVIDASIIRDEIQGRYPSDHFPVTARIQFNSSR